jgi:hypothetical protein
MSQVDHLRNQIRKYERHLQVLKDQKALHGAHAPSNILLEIEEFEEEVAKLQIELEETEQAGAQAGRSGPIASQPAIPWLWAVGGGAGVVLVLALVGGLLWFSDRSSNANQPDTLAAVADTATSELPSTPIPTPISSSMASPTATASPPATPGPIAPEPLFGDDFSGTELDPEKWVAIQGAGRIELEDDLVRLTSAGKTFPLMRPRENPFPARGDFSLHVSMRYLSAAERGSGFRIATTLAEYGANQALDRSELFRGRIIEVWQDAENWHISVGDKNTEVHVLTGPELSRFALDIDYVDNVYHVSLDGREVYVSNPTLERPTILWFGNPAQTDSNGVWSSLEIDQISIESPGD